LIIKELNVNTEVNIFQQRSTSLISNDLNVNINDNVNAAKREEETNPAPVSRSGTMDKKPVYFRSRRNSNTDNPPRPANAEGTGWTSMLSTAKYGALEALNIIESKGVTLLKLMTP
jgi:hypothetical protein